MRFTVSAACALAANVALASGCARPTPDQSAPSPMVPTQAEVEARAAQLFPQEQFVTLPGVRER